jgi:NAD(P)-dependent dehydrogenase (short-subunit alcohol dehydrogenase family)
VDPSLPALDGTVALVTGGSGGIGSGIALRFAMAGAAVVVHHHTGAQRARAVADEIVAAGRHAVTAQATSPTRGQLRRSSSWRSRGSAAWTPWSPPRACSPSRSWPG